MTQICIDFVWMYVVLFSIVTLVLTNAVTWKAETPIIRFGEELILVCTVHEEEFINPTETRKWFKGSNLASYNGQTTNPLKYKESLNRNKFKLHIYNVTEADLNCEYQCLYSFETYSQILRITLGNFEYPPTEKNLELEYDYATNGKLSVKLYMKKVFPLPSCTVSIEGLQLTFAKRTYKTKGLYFEVHLLHQSNHKFKEDTPFNVTCKLQQEYVIATKVIKGAIPVINSDRPFLDLFFILPLVYGILVSSIITVITGFHWVDIYNSQ